MGAAGERHSGIGGRSIGEGERVSERVRQRVNNCAGVRRVSDLGHTSKIFFFFYFEIHLCRVPQILAHGKDINFAVCLNLNTRQLLENEFLLFHVVN